jgi:hypothetical protein
MAWHELVFLLCATVTGLALAMAEANAAEPIDIASRRDLFVDDHLTDRFGKASAGAGGR